MEPAHGSRGSPTRRSLQQQTTTRGSVTALDALTYAAKLVDPGSFDILSANYVGAAGAAGYVQFGDNHALYGDLVNGCVVLSSGFANLSLSTSSSSSGAGGAWGLPGDADIAAVYGINSSDAAALTLQVRAKSTGNLTFRYVFASEEYSTESSNSTYTDAFMLLVNGSNKAVVTPAAGPPIVVPAVAPAPPNATNVARGKYAYASSVYVGYGWDLGNSYGPEKAVDGRTTGITYLMHTTNAMRTPWLAVDHGASYYINRFKLYNRDLDCGWRLAFAEVRIGWQPITQAADAAHITDNELVWKMTNASYNGAIYDIGLSVRQGRIVTLQNFNPTGYQDDWVLNIQELEVYGWPMALVPNVALGKAAFASSVYDFGGGQDALWTYGPDKAVDGGVVGMSTLFHSHGPNSTAGFTEPNPWLAVDLGGPYDIQRVKIYNRKTEYNCCGDRLGYAEVRIGWQPITQASDAPHIIDNELVWKMTTIGTIGALYDIPVVPVRRGRITTLQNFRPVGGDGTQILNIEEIEVYGWPSPDGLAPAPDVALGKPAYASSVYSTNWPAQAFDGNLADLFHSLDSSNGFSEPNPWLAVDLGAPLDVQRVKLYNRRDCCGDRLAFAEVRIGSQPITRREDSSLVVQNELVWKMAEYGATGAVYDVQVYPVRRGRYTTLQNFHPNGASPGYPLHIQELELYGPVMQTPPAGPPVAVGTSTVSLLSNRQYYRSGGAIEYGGYTTVLTTATVPVLANDIVDIKFAVADAGGDNYFDSAVFIEAGSVALSHACTLDCATRGGVGPCMVDRQCLLDANRQPFCGASAARPNGTACAVQNLTAGTCSACVCVGDTTGPVVTPSLATVIVTADMLGGVSSANFSCSAQDDQDGPLPVAYAPRQPGDFFPVGTTIVTCEARDAAGNRAAANITVTVRDKAPPVVSVTNPFITVSANASGGNDAINYFACSALDLVDGPVPVTYLPRQPGSFFPVGTTVVSCRAEDSSGNVGTGRVYVTVKDTTPPELAVSEANIVVSANAAGGIASRVPFSCSAHDVVDGRLGVTYSPKGPNSFFSIGTTVVTCCASDKSANTACMNITVSVVDSTPPVLKLPRTPLLSQPGSPAGAIVSFNANASDTVDGPNVPVSCTPPSGSVFELGTHVVTCEARDAAGNTATAAFDVVVGTKGLLSAGYPRLVPIACGTNPTALPGDVGTYLPEAAAGVTGTAAGRYGLVARLSGRVQAGGCYRFDLRLRVCEGADYGIRSFRIKVNRQ
ncbi:hypothetical protein HYH03_008346 [Edaphochlamys debaryana]|uniref:HYR domain-containing protein n=1 Tax=Edaphochlamys debaryana TaxID=47281 RepID=A0A835XYS2_9CHLO|nr:hypothetical protein HYH03_008346 [Edaphochlamys debaryana]|eukprot:KAG2493532.1 hypothetical protein HYH03_008346 [Edaphochlamys debaryana]